MDPDQTEPRTPGEWILIDQYGGHNADDVPGMVSDAVSCAQAVLPPCSLAAA